MTMYSQANQNSSSTPPQPSSATPSGVSYPAPYSPMVLESFALLTTPPRSADEVSKARFEARLNVSEDGCDLLNESVMHPQFEPTWRHRREAYEQGVKDVRDAITGMSRIADSGAIAVLWDPEWTSGVPIRSQDIKIDVILSRYLRQAFRVEPSFEQELNALVQKHFALRHVVRFPHRLRRLPTPTRDVFDRRTKQIEFGSYSLHPEEGSNISTTATVSALASARQASNSTDNSQRPSTQSPSTPQVPSPTPAPSTNRRTHSETGRQPNSATSPRQQTASTPRPPQSASPPSRDRVPSPTPTPPVTDEESVHNPETFPQQDSTRIPRSPRTPMAHDEAHNSRSFSSETPSSPFHVNNPPSPVRNIAEGSSITEMIGNISLEISNINLSPIIMHIRPSISATSTIRLTLSRTSTGNDSESRPSTESPPPRYSNLNAMLPEAAVTFLNSRQVLPSNIQRISEALNYADEDWIQYFTEEGGLNPDDAGTLRNILLDDEEISRTRRDSGFFF